MSFWDLVNRQDWHIVEQGQQGIASRRMTSQGHIRLEKVSQQGPRVPPLRGNTARRRNRFQLAASRNDLVSWQAAGSAAAAAADPGPRANSGWPITPMPTAALRGAPTW